MLTILQENLVFTCTNFVEERKCQNILQILPVFVVNNVSQFLSFPLLPQSLDANSGTKFTTNYA